MSLIDQLDQRLAAGEVVILDGGVGTELQARGVPMDSDAWSGVANLTHQQIVRSIHEDYIRAGADVIVANTYAAARRPLEWAGYGDRTVDANRLAVEAAIQARENVADRPVAVAGSISGAAAIDVGGLGRPMPRGEELLAHYREQAQTQAEAGVDLFALEFITASSWGSLGVEAAHETELPVWLGVSANPLENGQVITPGPEGEPLDELLEAFVTPDLSAITVMHSVIEAVEPALELISRYWGGTLGTYPHHGDFRPPQWIFGDLTPRAFADRATRWVAMGVQLIGGCCGIGPDHIRVLKESLPSHRNSETPEEVA